MELIWVPTIDLARAPCFDYNLNEPLIMEYYGKNNLRSCSWSNEL